MIYAQFYQRSAIDPKEVIEACGDRSVLILDSRFSSVTHEAWATEWCRKHSYVGWSIHRGRDLLDPDTKTITPYTPLKKA